MSVLPKPNFAERAMALFAPERAQAAFANRVGFYQVGQFTGGKHERQALKHFNPFAGSADADTIGDLVALRARSRDLDRNDGIARGARNTSRVNVVGSGLRLKAQINYTALGITEAEAEVWEDKAEALFDLWASSKNSDVTRTQSFYEQQALAFVSAWQNGDVFALRRFKEDSSTFLGLCVQLLEADRVCTPYGELANYYFRDGVEIDADGAPVAYHVLNRHPGDTIVNMAYFTPADWKRVPAKGDKTGPIVLHLFDKDRIGLSRGVPALAPVIEDLKQLNRYSEAELMAAVVSAFFTVFIKNDSGAPSDVLSEPSGHHPRPPGSAECDTHFGPTAAHQNDVELGSGTIVELGSGESIETANPARPNANFDPFFLAIVRKIGVSLGIPYEVLIMHFSSSYSASRAALEVAWQFFMDRRVWLARNLCQPVYEWFLYEAITRDLLSAPGFFDDPVRRAAWCGSEWIGPARIVLDPAKEANAEQAWIDMGAKTLEQVTINQTGGNWKRNQEQRGRERELRVKLELEPADPPATESSSGRPLQGGGGAAPTGGGKTPAKGAKKK